ncbi:MAG: glycosyltransferase family 4 protein [Bacteroidales bacterium]|nr:glycosyltransferase family 4 protein [Bacteroidales bacterium]
MIRISPFLGNVDRPNSRRQSSSVMPTAGGIAIAGTWYIGIFYLLYIGSINSALVKALLSGLILVVVGLVDDIFEIKPGIRIVAQIISVGLALYFLGGLNYVDFGFTETRFSILLTPLAFLGILWMINLYNFMDGIDGFAALETAFISLFLFLFAGASYNLLLLAAILGFLIWNWPKAKIYMGDTGSTLIGFTFGVLLIRYQNTGQLNLFTALIPISLFWFDASLTLFRRWRNKEKLSVAHKKHAYQRLVQSGFSHQKVVLWSLMVNGILFALAWGAYTFPKFVLLFFGVALVLLYGITRWVDKRKAFKKKISGE